MQAISTKYLTMTGKIKACCQAKTKAYHWIPGLSTQDNHVQAAKSLATELGWNYGRWHMGTTKSGEIVFVCESDESFIVEA